ncbi:MAG: hypothetical protein IJ545_07020 [Alphaproteobacteria bacterium]|nr:hypothetical protein [Alphaproteobacteria bacterium]
MKKHKRHITHLPDRFLLATPEENLVAAIIKQAWCDAFCKKVKDYYGNYHRNADRKYAVRMFEGEITDEYRKSLGYLADALGVDDATIVHGYGIYKKMVAEGRAKYKPSEAFDALLKILIKEREK